MLTDNLYKIEPRTFHSVESDDKFHTVIDLPMIHTLPSVTLTSRIFSSNFKAFASELLENPEEMFSQYYI